MTAIGIKEILSPNLDKAFVLAGEIVRDCIFYKTESNAGTGLLVMTALSASVKALVTLYGHRDIDGLSILFGDEKLIVRSAQLSTITNPGAGDYMLDVLTGVRWEVITAHQDPTATFWVFQCRRTPNEDWGDLTPYSQSEDWGDLTTATLFDDWQS